MMRIAEAIEAFCPHRSDALVVPGRGGRYWVEQTTSPQFDAPLGDPAMGGHAGFGLGLALARPERKLVLFDSEGDILMSLGMLATIAEQAPANFYHFVLDNECYATTGGQPVPNAKTVAYDLLAKGSGYPRAFAFTDLGEFQTALPGIMGARGPVFVALKGFPDIEDAPIAQRRKWNRRGKVEVLTDLKGALGVAKR